MEFDNHNLIGKLLQIINQMFEKILYHDELAFEIQSPKEAFQDFIHEQQDKRPEYPISPEDVYQKLQFFFHKWDSVKDRFKRKWVARSYINILLDFRNKWAHHRPDSFSNDDVSYACNTALRLAHLAEDAATILELESIFEYLGDRVSQPGEKEAAEITPELEESLWKIFSLEHKLWAAQYYSGVSRLIDEFSKIVYEFCYPWDKYKPLFQQYLQAIFDRYGFFELQDLCDMDNVDLDDPETVRLFDSHRILKDIYENKIELDSDTLYSLYPPKLLVPGLVLDLCGGEVIFPDYFEDAEPFLIFLDIFKDEIRALKNHSEYSHINWILNHEIDKNDYDAVMGFPLSIVDEERQSNVEANVIADNEDDEEDEFDIDDVDNEDLFEPEEEVSQSSSVNSLSDTKNLVVQPGQYPNTLFFSEGGIGFAFGFRKLKIIYDHFHEVVRFASTGKIKEAQQGTYLGNDVICLPSTDDCAVMFGRIKAKLLAKSVSRFVPVLVENGYIRQSDINELLDRIKFAGD